MTSPPTHFPRGPLFVVGVGRSGSTALHRLLALHPSAGWLSGFSDRYPHRPAWNRLLLEAAEWPAIGGPLRRRFKPGECWQFWNRVHPGFRRPYRDLTSRDVTARDRQRFPEALASMLPSRRQQAILKLTGWPRIGFLREIFPEARFLHLVRDGRAVAASLLAVHFWRGWQGPGGWRWGPLSQEDELRWKSCDESFPALAGLQWERLVKATGAAAEALPPEAFLEVRYEDLCASPETVLPRILSFAGLPPSPVFQRRAQAFPLRDANHKWRQALPQEHQELLTGLLSTSLERHGYLEHHGYLPDGAP